MMRASWWFVWLLCLRLTLALAAGLVLCRHGDEVALEPAGETCCGCSEPGEGTSDALDACEDCQDLRLAAADLLLPSAPRAAAALAVAAPAAWGGVALPVPVYLAPTCRDAAGHPPPRPAPARSAPLRC